MLGGTFNCCCRFLFWIANLSASFWQVVPASVFCSSMLPPQTECRTGARNRVEPLRYYRSDGVYDKRSQQMFSNGKLSAIWKLLRYLLYGLRIDLETEKLVMPKRTFQILGSQYKAFLLIRLRLIQVRRATFCMADALKWYKI